MTSQEDAVRALLHTVDGLEAPLPPTLVPRAEARWRRRRVTTGVLVGLVGVGVAGGALAMDPARRSTPEPPVAATPAPARTASATPTSTRIPAAEIIRRCAPQMKAWSTLPQYRDMSQWRVVHSFDHQVGDVVALSSGRGNPAYCLLPAVGDESKPVPRGALDPSASQPERLLELCAEGQGTSPDEDDRDLRRGQLLRALQDGPGMVQALVSLDGRVFGCTAMPPSWDLGGIEVTTIETSPAFIVRGSGTGAAHKSVVQDTAVWYRGSGRFPTGGGRIELFEDGRLVGRFPVSSDGLWNVLVRRPGGGGVQDLGWQRLDASGKVVAKGSTLG